ncbi:MAG TPA: hypothetical protein V6C89_15505 [Drouetiella sp.]
MDTSETEQADRSAKHLTRLYILALSAIAVLLIAGQVSVQLSIFKRFELPIHAIAATLS